MINFLNNGGLEMMLAIGYFLYIMILAKIEDKRVQHENEPVKWHW